MIAGMGFAQMAWKEAQRRAYDQTLARGYVRDIGPWPRRMLDMRHNGPGREYYRICDKAWHAFKTAETLRNGEIGWCPTVRL